MDHLISKRVKKLKTNLSLQRGITKFKTQSNTVDYSPINKTESLGIIMMPIKAEESDTSCEWIKKLKKKSPNPRQLYEFIRQQSIQICHNGKLVTNKQSNTYDKLIKAFRLKMNGLFGLKPSQRQIDLEGNDIMPRTIHKIELPKLQSENIIAKNIQKQESNVFKLKSKSLEKQQNLSRNTIFLSQKNNTRPFKNKSCLQCPPPPLIVQSHKRFINHNPQAEVQKEDITKPIAKRQIIDYRKFTQIVKINTLSLNLSREITRRKQVKTQGK